MSIRSRLTVPVALCALGVGVLGVARAQPARPASPAPAAATQGAVGLQRPVALTVDEMRRKGDGTVARIDTASGNVRRMLEQARSQRDVVKTLCLNDKLTQLDVTLRSAKERRTALENAANRRDNELVGHEFTILGVYSQRADRLSADANQCIGSEAGYLGETRITYTIDPTIPDGEGQFVPSLPSDTIFVPPATCASCSF